MTFGFLCTLYIVMTSSCLRTWWSPWTWFGVREYLRSPLSEEFQSCTEISCNLGQCLSRERTFFNNVRVMEKLRMLRYMPHFYSQSCCVSENGDVMCVLRHTCQMQDEGDCVSEERNEKHKHMNNHCRRFTNEKEPKSYNATWRRGWHEFVFVWWPHSGVTATRRGVDIRAWGC